MNAEDILDMVILSVMALPQVGHMAWSTCEVGGADVELCALPTLEREKSLAASMEEWIPSREIVIGEGVRPSVVVVVCSGARVRVSLVPGISTSDEVELGLLEVKPLVNGMDGDRPGVA